MRFFSPKFSLIFQAAGELNKSSPPKNRRAGRGCRPQKKWWESRSLRHFLCSPTIFLVNIVKLGTALFDVWKNIKNIFLANDGETWWFTYHGRIRKKNTNKPNPSNVTVRSISLIVNEIFDPSKPYEPSPDQFVYSAYPGIKSTYPTCRGHADTELVMLQNYPPRN